MENEEISPLTLKIEKEIWEKFKEKIPRTKTLNDALVELIKQFLSKNVK